jgi:hypothetical protein
MKNKGLEFFQGTIEKKMFHKVSMIGWKKATHIGILVKHSTKGEKIGNGDYC